MKFKSYQTTIALSLIFFLALQIPFTRILNSGISFTLFDFFAPVTGAFLGTSLGIFSVLIAQGLNIIFHGISNLNLAVLIRIVPTLFAVGYFSQKRQANPIIALLCIIAFNLNPIGRSAWEYSLFWIIPVIANRFHTNLFLRSLGATFTAHGVGSVLWLYAFGLPKEMWLTLIPQVMMERTLFAAGISVSYQIGILIQQYFSPVRSTQKLIMPQRFN